MCFFTATERYCAAPRTERYCAEPRTETYCARYRRETYCAREETTQECRRWTTETYCARSREETYCAEYENIPGRSPSVERTTLCTDTVNWTVRGRDTTSAPRFPQRSVTYRVQAGQSFNFFPGDPGGNPAPGFELENDPAWVSASSSGRLSGTAPSTPQTARFTLIASNNIGSDSVNVTIIVQEAPPPEEPEEPDEPEPPAPPPAPPPEASSSCSRLPGWSSGSNLVYRSSVPRGVSALRCSK